MQKWREQLPRVLFDSALIVFSILLALAVDEWRQERRQAALLEEARAAFVEEIRQNLTMVRSEEHLPRRRRLWRRFQDLGRLPSPTTADLAEVWDELGSGIRPTPYRDAVWRSLSAGDIMGKMSFAERFMLADIYREQAGVDVWHERMLTAWSHLRSDRTDPALIRDDVERTRSYLADVVAAEERLIALYEEALRQFDASPRPPTASSP